jgi:hypothetical protein
MIVQEAHTQFKVGVDKTDSLNSANFQVEEIDLYLSDAQEQFISQRAWGNNYKRESLEETQKRVADLQTITKNANLTTFVNNSDNKPNGFFVELPNDYRYAINEEITVSYTDCNNTQKTTRIPVIALTHDRYNKTIVSPFTKPSLNKAYRLPYGRFNNKEHFELIIPANTTLTTYHLRYLKTPAKIDMAQRLTPPGLGAAAQIEMADEACREIIRIAVRNALGDIESNRTSESIERLKEIE